MAQDVADKKYQSGYASVDLSERRLGDALGRLGTWGVGMPKSQEKLENHLLQQSCFSGCFSHDDN